MLNTMVGPLLRCDAIYGGMHHVGYTLDIREDRLQIFFVVPPAVGEPIALTLSLAGLIHPVALSGTVHACVEDEGFGKPAHVVVELKQPAPTSLCAPVAASVVARPCRLLLVEDSALSRKMVELKMSQGLGDTVEIISVSSPDEAWKYLSREEFDLVLLDHYLPSMTGAQMVRTLRTSGRNADVPVISMSVDPKDAREESLQAGADLFIDKPVVFKMLIGTIQWLSATLEANRAQARGENNVGSKSVLLMDDSKLLINMASRVLSDAGYSVRSATNLAEFDDQCRSHPPDLVVMDVQMPEAMGDDLAMVMREAHSFSGPIVLFSSLPPEELEVRAEEAGATAFACKRHGMGALLEKVREAIPENLGAS